MIIKSFQIEQNFLNQLKKKSINELVNSNILDIEDNKTLIEHEHTKEKLCSSSYLFTDLKKYSIDGNTLSFTAYYFDDVGKIQSKEHTLNFDEVLAEMDPVTFMPSGNMIPVKHKIAFVLD